MPSRLDDDMMKIVDTDGDPICHEDDNGQLAGITFDLPPKWKERADALDQQISERIQVVVDAMAWREGWLRDCSAANRKKGPRYSISDLLTDDFQSVGGSVQLLAGIWTGQWSVRTSTQFHW